MKSKIIILLIGYICVAVSSLAQEKLSLEQAVKIALDKNYDIKLVANDLSVSQNNVSRAISTMLPAVNGNFTTNNSIQNINQTLSNGQIQSRNGAENSNRTYGVNLNWLLFDGFAMFAQYHQLKELQKLEETNLRATVLNTITDVINTYYDLVQQQQQIAATEMALDISRFRMQTAKNRFEIGKAARLEVLAANVDFNTDTTALLRQRTLFKETQIRLNTLMARDVNAVFLVDTIMQIDNSLQLGSLIESSGKQNPALQAAIINKRVAELTLKQVQANRYPDISLSSGYNFSRSTSELGFAQTSRTRGFNYGLTASINIFNGFLQHKNEKNARLGIESAKLEYEKTQLNVTSQLTALYQNYITNLDLVKLEAQNQQIARQNLDITLEKFRLGSIAPIEFREAQRNYVDATVRYANAQYQAKLAEVALKQLAGNVNL